VGKQQTSEQLTSNKVTNEQTNGSPLKPALLDVIAIFIVVAFHLHIIELLVGFNRRL
jgi:hypothetical protein